MRFLLILVTISSFIYAQNDIIPKFREASDLVEKKQYSAAKKILAGVVQNTSQEWVKNEAYYQQSLLFLAQGKTDSALDALEKSVAHGFNNFYTLHQTPAYQKLFSTPRFQKIYKKMRISPADTKELFWLMSELSFVSSQTSTMITENMGRPDSDYTNIPQSALPMRTPQSSTIITVRAYVRYMQEHQKQMVFQSDVSRIGHNSQMNIIDGMGTPDPWQQQQKLMRIQQAKVLARQRTQQRQREVQQRRFILPPGTSEILQPCPELGSVKLEKKTQIPSKKPQPATKQTPPPKQQPVTSSEMKLLQKLVGKWQGTGQDQGGKYTCSIQAKYQQNNTVLYMELSMQRTNGAIENSTAQVTYNNIYQKYAWNTTTSNGVVSFAGIYSPSEEAFIFQLTNGQEVYCKWVISDQKFQAVLQAANAYGQFQVIAYEEYSKVKK